MTDGMDDLYERARALVLREGYATVSLIQRNLELGFGAGSAIVARLEAEGVVGSPDLAGRRALIQDGR